MAQQNWWEADPIVGGQAGGLRPITPPDPVEQRRLQLSEEAAVRDARRDDISANTAALQNQVTQLTIADKQREATAAAEKQAAQERGITDARGQLVKVIEAAKRAKQLSRDGWFATGIGSSIAGGFEGTTARDLQGELDTIGANTAFDTLQKMREQSPTGGALGAVTERELQLLQAAVASLDRGASDETFQRRMDDIIQRYEGVLNRLPGENPREADQNNAGLAANAANTSPPPSGGPVAPERMALTGDNLVDFAIGLSGGKYDVTQDGGLLYNGAPVQASMEVLNSEPYREAYRAKFGEYPALAVDVEGGKAVTRTELERNRDTVTGGIDAVIRGAADVPTFGMADEIAAAGRSIFGGGTMAQNLTRERAIDAADEAVNPYLRMTGQIAGGLLLPSRVGAVAKGAGRAAIRAGMTREQAVRAAWRSGAQRAGMEGGAFGAAYGFGSTEGDIGDRLAGGAVSGGTGLLAGYAAGRALGAVGGRGSVRGANGADPARIAQVDAARAAQDLNIDMPRYVAGGPSSRRMAAWVEGTPFGAGPIGRGVDRMLTGADEAATRIANDVAVPQTAEGMGEAAIRGGADFVRRTSEKGGDLYAKAERLSGDTRVPLTEAKTEVARQIAELSDTPGVAPEMLAPLQKIAQNIDGEWTPKSIRNMRTQLEAQFGEAGMMQGDASRRARLITQAAEDDMIRGLNEAGQNDAAKAWQRASGYWRARADRIETALVPILGKDNAKTADDVARALSRDERGNGARLAAFLKSMPRDEANEVRSTLISQLGKATDGAQNAAGDNFSLDTFLTNWNRIKGSREQIFSRDTYLALNKLAKVAERAKDAGRSRNVTNSGNVALTGATFAPAGSILAGNLTGPLLTVGMALSQYGGGKLLSSPRFAQRLANMPTQPQNAARYWNGEWVNKLARTEPAIASDLLGLRSAVLRELGSGAPKVAASAPMDAQN